MTDVEGKRYFDFLSAYSAVNQVRYNACGDQRKPPFRMIMCDKKPRAYACEKNEDLFPHDHVR